MPTTTIQTWTHTTTASGTITSQLRACTRDLPIDADGKWQMIIATVDIVLELDERDKKNVQTPYVVTLDKTEGGLSSDTGVVAIKQWWNQVTAQDKSLWPPEVAKKILVHANPSTRYRIQTQDGNAIAQDRVEVFT